MHNGRSAASPERGAGGADGASPASHPHPRRRALTTFVLLHSPLLGPASWAPLADALQRAGHGTVVPDLRAAVTQPRHAPAWVEMAASALTGDGNVLVAHSGAGRLVAGVEGAYRAMVLVDAGLPGEPTHRSGAPSEFTHLIAQLAGADGMLPPWPQWWPAGALDTIVPDVGRRQLLDDAPQVPVAIFDEELPAACAAPDEHVTVAYLALGDGYATEAAEAERRGWTVDRIAGAGHLHHLVDPGAVAAAVLRLSS